MRRSSAATATCNRRLFRRYLECAFPGKPIAAAFRHSNDKQPTASEIADLSGKLKVAGWRIKQEELEEAVGYTLEKDDGGQGLTPSLVAPSGGFAVGYSLPSASAAVGQHALPSVGGDPRAPRSQLFNKAAASSRPPYPDGDGRATSMKSPQTDILSAFASDTGPAAEAIQELLKNPSTEATEQLLADLPTLLPDDPALAAVIAEEMARAFGEVKVEGQGQEETTDDGRARAPRDPQTNKNDQPRGKSSPESTSGSFAPAGGGEAAHNGEEAKKEEPKNEESQQAKAKREKHEWQVKALSQGTANMQKVRSGQDRPDFMPGLTLSNGKKISHIAFYQSGLVHVCDNMQGDFGNGKFGFNHQPMLVGDRIPNTIAQGTWYKQGSDYVAELNIKRQSRVRRP